MKDKEMFRWILIAAALAIFFSGFGMFGFGFRNSYGFPGMMGMMYGSYGSGMMFFGWLYGALVLVALVLLIMWLWQKVQNPRKR